MLRHAENKKNASKFVCNNKVESLLEGVHKKLYGKGVEV